MQSVKQKLLVIVGPTASGKSDLAVELALKLNGEIISADSRQVYKGLDIGTGKITQTEMKGVPHYLLDVVDPSVRFTVNDWKKAAEQKIVEITSRGKLPIIVGGTGFYIDSLLNNYNYPEVEIDEDEQAELEKKSAESLFEELRSLDPRRAAEMQKTSNYKNPRRLARAILIARELGEVPELESAESKYNATWIGILPSDKTIKERIRTRLIKRLDSGMIEEAQKLHQGGLSFERMEELGLEYRYLARFIQGQLTREQLIEELATKIWQYAKRQKTWWKRNKDINWFPSLEDALSKYA